MAVELDVLVTDILANAVNLLRSRGDALFESESPCVDQWSYGDVEGTFSFFRYVERHADYLLEHASLLCLRNSGSSLIHFRDDRLLVEHRECIIYFL